MDIKRKFVKILMILFCYLNCIISVWILSDEKINAKNTYEEVSVSKETIPEEQTPMKRPESTTLKFVPFISVVILTYLIVIFFFMGYHREKDI